MKKLLIIGMSNSIHTARWIKQLNRENFDIHLFPSIDYGISHQDLSDLTIYHSFYSNKENSKINYRGFYVFSKLVESVLRYILQKQNPSYRVDALLKVIQSLKPDIVHSLEIQHAGYMTLEVKKRLKNFPKWIVTNWGSDIYLFGRLASHKEKIKEVLQYADYYSCECQRDVLLAKEYGIQNNKILPVIPNSGGIENNVFEKSKINIKPSQRNKIVIKGYQGWSGRALNALYVIKRCASELGDYEIIIFSASDEIKIVAELLQYESNLKITILENNSPREKILEALMQARVYIGLSISDGLSTTMLEALALGVFVIQSSTSCVQEIIQHGITGYIVDPENYVEVEKALKKILEDDLLVDQAAEINYTKLKILFDYRAIQQIANKFYSV